MTINTQSNQDASVDQIQVPAYALREGRTASESSAPLNNNILILVIDDDLIMRNLLKIYLDNLGYQTAAADNGETGLNLAKQLHPQAILLDVMMPGMDGWSVLSALKKDPELTTIPIIMVSILEDKQIGELLGAAEYLIKPIKRKELNTILQKHISTTVDKPQVLLVEDDVVLQNLTAAMLTGAGWQVQTANNGRQALDYLSATHNLPQLILSDLIMPEMDGFELITALRQHAIWQTIPVVVLTAKKITEAEQILLNTHAANQIIQKNHHQIQGLLNEIQQCLTKP